MKLIRKFFFFFLNLFNLSKLDKHRDPAQYMVKADELGAKFVRFFVKYFLILSPISSFVNCVGNVIYNQWNYGHLDPHKLYHVCRFVYAYLKLFYLFDF